MRSQLVLACLILAGAAQAAPSFDCAKASSKAERAICANPEAAALDSAIADAYRLAVSRMGEDAQALARLRKDQQAFVSARDRFIDNQNLVLTDYMGRRRDFLLALDPTPRAGLEGNWRSFWGETRIARNAQGGWQITHWMSEPVVHRWTCGDPMESSAAKPVGEALVTGSQEAGLRFEKRGLVLHLTTLSEPGVEPATSCGHLGPETNVMFPVMSPTRAGAASASSTPSPAPKPGRNIMDYLRLTTSNDGNDHRFFQAAEFRAPPLAERQLLLSARESANWQIIEQTPEHLRLRHKTLRFELELALRTLERDFLRMKTLNPHETKTAKRESVHYFEVLADGETLDSAYPGKLALAGEAMTPPFAYSAIPPAMKDHFRKVEICTHYEREEPFSPAEEKRLRATIRPEACKTLRDQEIAMRKTNENNPALADLLDRAILAYRSE